MPNYWPRGRTNNEGNTIRKRVIISNNTKLIKSYLRIVLILYFIIIRLLLLFITKVINNKFRSFETLI